MLRMCACLCGGLRSVFLVLLHWTLLVGAQDDKKDDSITVFTSVSQNVPLWAAPYSLTLNLTTQPGGPVGVSFTVIPLTQSIGLNGTGTLRGTIHIDGQLAAANVSTYSNLGGNQTIAYLSCDNSSSDGFLNPDKMLNRLMKAQLAAIVLYSTDKNICLINSPNSESPLPYTSILTMADSGEAGGVLAYLNGTRPVTSVSALIAGSTGHKITDSGSGGGDTNSTVAMSILYSITAIITLLFLVIIATGAIRAHRYPERYGPRGGHGGRPRQSRAKGLARAVLDTIPIVKFGNHQPPKPDLEIKLDTTTTAARGVPAAELATLSGVPPTGPVEGKSASAIAGAADESAGEQRSGEEAQPRDAGAKSDVVEQSESHTGCSICTEDFTVGEDVRVLPCKHQYHPHCVDPWLVKVSGTCPLCRLDLRPEKGHDERLASEHGERLAPPLSLEGEDGESSHAPHGSRLTRLFDVNRLRQLSVEERLEAFRQMMRAQSRPHDRDPDRDRPRAARLTRMLKDKFRIRTRSQPA